MSQELLGPGSSPTNKRSPDLRAKLLAGQRRPSPTNGVSCVDVCVGRVHRRVLVRRARGCVAGMVIMRDVAVPASLCSDRDQRCRVGTPFHPSPPPPPPP